MDIAEIHPPPLLQIGHIEMLSLQFGLLFGPFLGVAPGQLLHQARRAVRAAMAFAVVSFSVFCSIQHSSLKAGTSVRQRVQVSER